MMGFMRITLNGEALEIAEGQSVSDLLASLELADDLVAVERNLEIVPQSMWPSVEIEADDRIEIIHLVGGGG